LFYFQYISRLINDFVPGINSFILLTHQDMKNYPGIYAALFAGLMLALVFSCKKGEPNDTPIMGAEKSLTGIIFNPNLTYGAVTDYDGITYKTITIGTQTWMAENLRTTHYRNGDPIPNVTGGRAWMDLTSGAYCDYNNEVKYSNIYGRLYNLYAVLDSRNIAPPGWHLPSEADWVTMFLYIDPQYSVNGGLSSLKGLKLKETGWTHWIDLGRPDEEGTNETGFTAIPGGTREPYNNINTGNSWFLAGFGGWWNSDSAPMVMTTILSDMGRPYYYTKSGYSVRCVKD
jgi:uncharacterized protein (TIGR02145 family)